MGTAQARRKIPGADEEKTARVAEKCAEVRENLLR